MNNITNPARVKKLRQSKGWCSKPEKLSDAIECLDLLANMCVHEEKVRFVDRREGTFNLYSRSDAELLFAPFRSMVPMANGKTSIKSTFSQWLNWEDKTVWQGIIFDPDIERANREHPNALNRFQGFAKEPIPGDCSLYMTFIEQIICRGNSTNYEFVLDWIADTFQNPGRKNPVALALCSPFKGIGKSFFSDVIADCIGLQHCVVVNNPDALTRNFNASLEHSLLIQVEEGFSAKNKAQTSRFKDMITNARLEIERKGVDARMAPSFFRVIITSNEAHVFDATAGERRFLALDVCSSKAKDQEYFIKIKEQLLNGGYEAFMHAMLTREIKSNFSNPPLTETLSEQILEGMSGHDRWFVDLLSTGELAFTATSNDLDTFIPIGIADNRPNHLMNSPSVHWPLHSPWRVSCADMYKSFLQYSNDPRRRPSPADLGRFLAKAMPAHDKKRGARDAAGGRVWQYTFPSLSEAREAYVAAHPGLRLATITGGENRAAEAPTDEGSTSTTAPSGGAVSSAYAEPPPATGNVLPLRRRKAA